jgi:prefoldin subunit 5
MRFKKLYEEKDINIGINNLRLRIKEEEKQHNLLIRKVQNHKQTINQLRDKLNQLQQKTH